ncbi:hypothetical protein QWZ13_10475 [Reinekea marina]|uniref:hypothetical protein n=1 Tax=Reinekea marina TaxID=1310421 RepID=UPI0025B3B032|nr:hypothetical protein [Reinekea marina]MDN3649336.1 hypothetical protein [Reinekea marina]
MFSGHGRFLNTAAWCFRRRWSPSITAAFPLVPVVASGVSGRLEGVDGLSGRCSRILRRLASPSMAQIPAQPTHTLKA